jgi:hypothetical protein
MLSLKPNLQLSIKLIPKHLQKWKMRPSCQLCVLEICLDATLVT